MPITLKNYIKDMKNQNKLDKRAAALRDNLKRRKAKEKESVSTSKTKKDINPPTEKPEE